MESDWKKEKALLIGCGGRAPSPICMAAFLDLGGFIIRGPEPIVHIRRSSYPDLCEPLTSGGICLSSSSALPCISKWISLAESVLRPETRQLVVLVTCEGSIGTLSAGTVRVKRP